MKRFIIITCALASLLTSLSADVTFRFICGNPEVFDRHPGAWEAIQAGGEELGALFEQDATISVLIEGEVSTNQKLRSIAVCDNLLCFDPEDLATPGFHHTRPAKIIIEKKSTTMNFRIA